jgi:calcineurin-like phosphoesterase
MRTKIPSFFRVADGDIKVSGALFDVDTDTGKVRSVTRVSF